MKSDAVIRGLNIAGTLVFATDKDTVLDVGLIKIQAGRRVQRGRLRLRSRDDARAGDVARPELDVGTPDTPIAAGKTALIRLHYVEGMDKESCPAIVCCGGRMDFHGSR